ncbi:MAG: hypothetical protein J6R38_05275 [Alistipes sp.]|nr:hypothetical protein [Alistipes sp.]
MTTKNFLSKLLVVAMFVAASATITSCHKDDVDNPQPEQPESKYRPGDDFFSYANAEKLQSLEGDTKGRHSWFLDIAKYNDPRLEAVKDNMPEYKAIRSSLAKLEAQEDYSSACIEGLVEALVGNIQTKEDAYEAYGKAIKLNIIQLGALQAAVSYTDFTIGYSIIPSLGFALADSETEAYVKPELDIYGSHRVPEVKHLKPYVSGTRSDSAMIDCILKGIGLDPQYYLHEPAYDDGFAALEQLSLEEWIGALREVMASSLLMYCADGAVEELSGGEYKSVADYLDDTLEYDLGYFTSYYYCTTYLTQESIDKFAAIGADIIATFRTRLENNSWLSAATIAEAIDKLDHMGMDYGMPRYWPITESAELGGDLLVEDMLDIKLQRTRVLESMLGKPYADYVPIIVMLANPKDPMYPYMINAFYAPSVNSFYILPPLMMEPACSNDIAEVEIYATLGSITGHEITHGYDKDGSKYDKYGQMNNWWDPEDLAKFTALNERRIANVSTYEIIPGMPSKADLTVGEDVADLGGVSIAYDLWCNILEERGVQGEELEEQKRAFFLNYAKLFFEKHPDSFMIERAKGDVHSPGHIRINSVVQHFDDWYELFDVQEGDALYLAPEDRLTIW